jgi:anti-sigma regulatory factor (Ser/Thr protein kinase)
MGGRAVCAGLTPSRLSDLVLAISELAGNSLRHHGWRREIQVWHTRGEIICQVADTGQLIDPLAGYRPAPDELMGVGGTGLWLVNQVCDLVQTRTGPAGTTIRLHMRLRRPSPSIQPRSTGPPPSHGTFRPRPSRGGKRRRKPSWSPW